MWDLLYGITLASITDLRFNAQCVRIITSSTFIHSTWGKPAAALNKDLAGPVTSALPFLLTSALPFLLTSALPSVNHAQDLAQLCPHWPSYLRPSTASTHVMIPQFFLSLILPLALPKHNLRALLDDRRFSKADEKAKRRLLHGQPL